MIFSKFQCLNLVWETTSGGCFGEYCSAHTGAQKFGSAQSVVPTPQPRLRCICSHRRQIGPSTWGLKLPPGSKVIKKYKISWGSFAMVKATLDLMRLAQSAGYERYVLISGQDLPIKSNRQIREFFDANKGTDFIQSLNLRMWDAGGFERVSHFHLQSPTGSKGLKQFLLKVGGKLLSEIQTRLGYVRKTSWDFYCGPQWVDLTGDTVDKVLSLVSTNPKFLRRFRATTCADEIFFQSAIHYLGLEDRSSNVSLRYIDWKSGPEYPRTLRADDYESLLASDALFARKFDTQVDAWWPRILLGTPLMVEDCATKKC